MKIYLFTIILLFQMFIVFHCKINFILFNALLGTRQILLYIQTFFEDFFPKIKWIFRCRSLSGFLCGGLLWRSYYEYKNLSFFYKISRKNITIVNPPALVYSNGETNTLLKILVLSGFLYDVLCLSCEKTTHNMKAFFT